MKVNGKDHHVMRFVDMISFSGFYAKSEARYSGKLFQRDDRPSEHPGVKGEAKYSGKLFNQHYRQCLFNST